MANSFFNLSDLNGTNGFVLNGINSGDFSGVSVSDTGDVNGDGFDDLIIGARFADPYGIARAGETYVVFGSGNGFNASFDLSTLDGSNGFVLNSVDSNDFLGVSVSSAGDVNGDGFDDIIIGAYFASPNGNFEAGETYVVFGSGSRFNASFDLSTLNGSNGFVLNGIDEFDRSGVSVSGAGDVNGDGFDDIIIGAFNADPNDIEEAGETYVVFGSKTVFNASFDLSSLDGSNGFVLNGIDNDDFSGISVSDAGDVNGDGFDDIIIGAPDGDPNDNFEAGETYVVFGSNTGFNASFDLSTLDGSNGFVLNGIDEFDFSGVSVSGAGDVNGDGFDDIIIGAPGAYPNGNESAGETYVVFGSNTGFNASFDLSTLDGSNGFILNSVDSNDFSGVSVSSAGDINGDGFDDIIIGARFADPNGREEAGETYIVFGSNSRFDGSFDLSSLDGSNGFILNGIDEFDFSGGSVSGAGDINGDGLDDLIIGAENASPNGIEEAGETYVLLSNTAPFLDLNGVEPGVDDTVTQVFLGSTLNLIDPSSTFINDNSGVLTEMTLTLLGAANGFFERLTVDARGTNITANYRSNSGVMTLSGEDSVDNYLQVLRSLQYQNIANPPNGGSRTVEIVADDGQVFNNFSQTARLSFNLAFANNFPTAINLDNKSIAENSADNTLIGSLSTLDPDAGDTHTYTLVDSAGGRFAINENQLIVADGSLIDFETATSHEITVRTTDQDGLSFDQLFTIEVNDANEAPTAISFFNGFVLNGIDEFDFSGGSVSGAGDVNGDGFDDIIIGADGAGADGIYDVGETYVVFGSGNGFNASFDLSTLDGTNGFVLNGIDEFDFSGVSVSGAGDVNGDGFDDIIIGAISADPNGNQYAGETYVVFGSGNSFNASFDLSTLDGTNGFVLNGIDEFDFSGGSVSDAGDINGDGFDDLIIGTPSRDPNGNSGAGETYVVFGSNTGFSSSIDLSTLDGTNGFVLNGIDSGDESGVSVSGAGDINGDGVDDIIIGATGADPNGNFNAGETYVVFGSNTGFSSSFDLSTLDGTNGFVLNGIDSFDNSGDSVSGAGDINGDGVDDLIIGAISADPNGNEYAGETYVVFGSGNGFNASFDLSTLDGSNGFVLNGINSGDLSGSSVSGAGDINGDGFDDLIIAAFNAGPNKTYGYGVGEIYVVFGSDSDFDASVDLSSLDGSNGFVLKGIDIYDFTGVSVSGAGDINGDGFDDLIIGTPSRDPNGNRAAGETYVIFGSDSGFKASIDLSTNNANVDENSANDTIIVDLFSIDPNSGDTHTYTLLDDAEGRFAINGNQLIVADGSLLDFETATSHEITIRTTDNGGLSFDQTFTIQVNDLNENFVPTAINLDNNNIAENSANDTIVGTLTTTDADATDTHSYTLLDDAEGRFAINGNQVIVANSRLLDFETATSHEITVRTTDSTGLSFEEVLTIEVTDVLDELPPTAISFLNGFVLNGIDEFDFSGRSVSSAGDVNGDGFDDIVIGADRADFDFNSSAGQSYVVFGSNTGFSTSLELSTLDGTNGFVLNGIDFGDSSGRSVSSAGDVNGDGFDDLIIGAPYAGLGGQTYVVFGSGSGFNPTLDLSTLDGSNGFVLNGIDFGDSSGRSVSGAGDINGDGFDDLIIGAPEAGPLGIPVYGYGDAYAYSLRVGESYVVFGSGSGFSSSLDLSSLDGSNGFVLNGIDSFDNSGVSVSGAGDVNGDGFDDLIIGARFADPNGNSSAGESYVVFGSNAGFNASLDLSTLDGTNGFVLNGIDEFDDSGWSVSGAGDVNGDGFDDLIIGAPDADPNGNSSAGESYVVFGSNAGFNASLDLSTLDGSNGFVLNGIDEFDDSGWSVSGAGDVNGDGFDDLIIGADRADPNGIDRAGESYVVFGSNAGFNASLDLSTLDGSNGFVLNGIDRYDNSGWSVSGAGDVNGDGFDDLIIGADEADPNGNRYAGESYLVFGRSSFGASIELSNLSSDTTNINENSANGTIIADFSSTDIDPFDTHTYTLLDDAEGRFAINGTQLIVADGSLLDFEIATFHEITVRSTDSKGLSFEQGLTVLVNDLNENFVPTAINLDNNTIVENSADETIVGTLSTTDADATDTHTYTLLDDAEGRFAINGTQLIVADGSLLDFEIATSHEITVRTTDSTGLSFEEVLTIEVTDVLDDLPPTAIGFVNGFVLNGIDSFDGSGRSVSGAGDVNGDGVDDLIIGADRADPNGIDRAGESYVVFGSEGGFNASLDLSTLDGSNGFVLNGIDNYDRSGGSVSGAGDINGDGFDDIIIGNGITIQEGQYDIDYAGESYVVFGSNAGFNASLDLSTLDGSNGFILNGIDSGDLSGGSVSGAGDVNGDGVDDIIIGARFADPNGNSYAGESYVVFGSEGGFNASLDLSTLDGSNGFVLNGIDSFDFSGGSVSSAGDVNGDGVDDLIIGATGADPNGNSSAGESYVVFGSNAGFNASLDLSTLDGSNGFVLNGIDRLDNSGVSVSGAGDVNGDGFDDLIIGADEADPNGNSSAGESYVVFGSNAGFNASLDLSTLDGSNGFVLNGIDSRDDSGWSVSGAGDINGDGFDDLIIGAIFADPNGNSSAGESYVVFGSNAGFNASLDLSTLDGSNGFVLNGIDNYDNSGVSVSGAGDINGDGFDDIIIGARYADPNGNSSAGESYVVFGRSSFGASIELSNLSSDTASINENSANGTIIADLTSTDINLGDTHTYTLLDDAEGRFAINGSQLIVADGSLLDFETATFHEITVRSTDSKGLSFEQGLTVLVNDVSETSGPTAINLDNNNIVENSPNDTFIGTLTTTDPDGDNNHIYTLLNDAEGRFKIVEDQLLVADGTLLDFEGSTSHIIEVETTDNTGLSFREALTINLSNLDPLAITINDRIETNLLERYGEASEFNGTNLPQDTDQAVVNYFDNEFEVQLVNNAWKDFDLGTYNITPNTLLAFEFRSDDEGEIHGIGFDNNDNAFDPGSAFFQLYGTQTWTGSNQTFNNYNAEDDWKGYTIDVGNFFTGSYDRLVLFNDNDVPGNLGGSSQFRNIVISNNLLSSLTANNQLTVTLDTNTVTNSLESYGNASIFNGNSSPQDSPEAIVTYNNNGNEVQIDNNGWKSLDITGYTVTENTLLSFQFRSQDQGELQGIGVDNDDDLFNNTNTFFKLYGTQDYLNQDFDDYDGLNDPQALDGWKDYSISLGQYFTGEYDRLVFFNDNDTVDNLGGSAQFRNIVLSEVV